MAEYIEREALVKYLVGYCEHLSVLCHNNDDIYAEMLGVAQCLDRVESAPKADVVEVRHGYWRGLPLGGNSYCRCSVCNNVYNVHSCNGRATQNYCPNCGAKMDGKGEGE